MRRDPVWRPDPKRAASSVVGRLLDELTASGDLTLVEGTPPFITLHRWSLEHPEKFWELVWRDGEIIADTLPNGKAWEEVLVGGHRMAPPDPRLGPRWFTGARLNFAENLLRRDDDADALIGWDERGRNDRSSWHELRREVASVAAGLRALGVLPGDRVAGWLPNSRHAIVAMLAASSIGAVWTSCSPDFGVDGIVDRFGQTTPVVLFFCDGYRYGGKLNDCLARAAELLPRLPSVRHAIMVSWHGKGKWAEDARVTRWEDLVAIDPDAPLTFERLPFDHPLYILYSSGTTGLPKCMVHGAGGTLLQHLKEHRFHGDLREGERIFYFTTCGWMMWNWLVSALAVGATLVLYDGAPLPGMEPAILWRMVATERVDLFGTSAKYLAMCEKHELDPNTSFDLSHIRGIFSTGSPLAAESFDWIGQHIGRQVQVASISGGTDIVSCFVLGNPISPVYRGEIQGPGLGMAVEVFDHNGTPCPVGTPGELVCTRPFPAMPIGFWNDPGSLRYHSAYFETFPGVWRHGDWIERTAHGGFIISGRSDTTLNPGGVRIGTAEIYRQVEAVPEVLESLVIGQRVPGGDVRVVLFVRMREGAALTRALEDHLRQVIRRGASPHHVPRLILAVTDLPRTRSGKLSEIAVRDTVEGRAAGNVGALANPESLDQFRGRPELAL